MDEKVRSSWSLKAAQAGIAPQASSPLGFGPIAALPVLPSAFSSATAEPRRQSDTQTHDAAPAPADATVAAKPLDAAPVVKPTEGAPALASDAQALAQAPVRISDLASANQSEGDAPACRTGDQTSLDPGQILSAPKGDENAPGAERQGAPEVPLPHCVIEFDPDADEGDVVAHAPSPQTVQVAAKSAGAASQAAQARTTPDKPQQGETAAAAAAAQAEAGSSQGTDQASEASPAAPASSDQPQVVTEATRGVGTAVIDPLVPIDSIVFGGTAPARFGEEAAMLTAPVPDPVADALAALATSPQPEFSSGIGMDLTPFG
jgi:hypothetical protein